MNDDHVTLEARAVLSSFDLDAWRIRRKYTLTGSIDEPPAGLSTDTRTIEPNSLFVALVGERFDAHDFLQSAYEQGARVAIVSRTRQTCDCPDDMALIHTNDTLDALQSLAADVWQEMILARGVKTISLTGSNGKTTSKEILRALYGARHAVYATPGNLNNHIGVPLTICAAPLSAEIIILEMGASKRGDIEELTRIAPAHGRLITSIGHAHLEGMGGLAGVRLTKREIFLGHDVDTVAVVPAHERGALITEDYSGFVLTFGLEDQGSDMCARIVGHLAHVMNVELESALLDDHPVHVTLPLMGEHHASNLAGCLGVMCGLGDVMGAEEIDAALAALALPGGRSEVIELGGFLVLDDSYNANPSSMMASFDAFLAWSGTQRGWEGAPRVAVIGEMAEVGEASKKWHERVACHMVEQGTRSTPRLDHLVCVGRYALGMKRATDALGIKHVQVMACEDLDAVARWLTDLKQGVMFLKASRSARLERLMEIIQDG